jgi:HEPN domain-containing protein
MSGGIGRIEKRHSSCHAERQDAQDVYALQWWSNRASFPMPLQTSLDRTKLCRLAGRYATDAETLLKNRRWSSAFYLSGYAIECALKACIAKQIRRHQFPNLETVRDSHTHDLVKLLKLAGLAEAMKDRSKVDVQFGINWVEVVTTWRETSRYDQPTQTMAEEMIRAVSDIEQGVLPWIQLYW